MNAALTSNKTAKNTKNIDPINAKFALMSK
jgi:hypothetical protein